MRPLGLEFLNSQVFIQQQYRSQALNENVKLELAPSSYVEDRKNALFHLVEQVNLRTIRSTDFLAMLGEQLLYIKENEDHNIWDLVKLDKPIIAIKQNKNEMEQ